MSKYLVNGIDISSFISHAGTDGIVSGYSGFPVANVSSLTSNFELQKTDTFLNNGVDIIKTNKYIAAVTNCTSSQTITPDSRPAWANHVNIVSVGGGGGGGAGANGSSSNKKGGGAGGSGGSGGYMSNSNNTPIPLGANENIEITIGAGGTGGAPGTYGESGGAGGATSVAMQQAGIKMIAYGGNGGGGGSRASNKDGNGGGGGNGALLSVIQSYTGSTYSGGLQFNQCDGSGGAGGAQGSWGTIYAYGGTGTDYKMNSMSLYPDIRTYGRSGDGGHGGYGAGQSGVGYFGIAGTSGFVRIYWLKSNNTV